MFSIIFFSIWKILSKGIDGAGKGKFYYHMNNIHYIKRVINNIDLNNIDHNTNNIDLKLNEKDLKSKNNLSLLTGPGSIVRSSIGGCRPPDPGSNPGQGANYGYNCVL